MLSDDMKLFRKRLRKFRQANGLSQAKLEERIGKERNYITRVETGRILPPIDVVSSIAENLGIPIAQLFSEDQANMDAKALRNEVRQLINAADLIRLRLYYRVIRAIDE